MEHGLKLVITARFTFSLENIDNLESKRHICFEVEDLEKAKSRLVEFDIEIIPDEQPVKNWLRFYFRDPGGNRLEFAQKIIQ